MAGEDRLSSLFQALADPTRLRIMALARSMELSVGELANVLGQSQPRVSRHVRILDEARIIRRRREGAWVFISVAGGAVDSALGALIEAAASEDDVQRFAADAARLNAVREERAEAARAWFAERADDWDQLRSLHAPDEQVEAAIAKLIGGRDLGLLVDVGTGTGRMLELFAGQSRAAIGIDRSPEMLRLARVKLDALDEARASLRQGDMFALPLADGVADTVILHQVLHFADNPAHAIAEAARIMAPGGMMIIVDFAAHDHEELRLVHRHQRLGFTDEAMAGWFAATGLEGDQPVKLSEGKLTVNVWKAGRPAAADDGREAA